LLLGATSKAARQLEATFMIFKHHLQVGDAITNRNVMKFMEEMVNQWLNDCHVTKLQMCVMTNKKVASHLCSEFILNFGV
jgi:hypothetical protein